MTTKQKTPFSKENKEFTDKCHLLARDLFYPAWFKVSKDNIAFTDTDLGTTGRNTILDGEMAVDRIISIQRDGLRIPIEYMIQERFRDPSYAKKRDITITEWNTLSNEPSELYKLKSGLFVYGYANSFDAPTDFIEVIGVDTSRVLSHIVDHKIKYFRMLNYRTEQYFIVITFKELERNSDILYTYKPKEKEIELKPSGIHWPGYKEPYHPMWPKETLENWVKNKAGSKEQLARYAKDTQWYKEH